MGFNQPIPVDYTQLAAAVSSVAKKQNKVTLTSGTSWLIPAGVTQIVATLIGGGGGGSGGANPLGNLGNRGGDAQIIASTLTGLIPGNSISYAIGAGGTGATAGNGGTTGGTTSMTGATSAIGGLGAPPPGSGGYATNQTTTAANNGGYPGNSTNASLTTGGNGGNGSIVIEYWV